MNVSSSLDKSEIPKRLSRSDSWTYYDTTPSTKPENVDEVDRISSVKEEAIEKCVDRDISMIDRTSYASNESQASIQNSLYENLSSIQFDYKQSMIPSDTRQQSSKSVLFEFDPFARTSEENVYSNYENNDLMLLEALLATNDSPNTSGSTTELAESVDIQEEQDDEEALEHPNICSTPPEPPKRFDSLPKNEYDEAEGVEQSYKITKNPALLPKLAHLVAKKQPAVPPRRSTRKTHTGSSPPSPPPKPVVNATAKLINNVVEDVVNSPSSSNKITDDHRKISMIQKLKKLRQESTVHAIKPNVISFVKSGSKLLSRTREHVSESGSRSLRMERPKVNVPQNPVTHRGLVYR